MTNLSKRLELHEKLVDILGSDHVYFQPPESIQIKYPCIIYQLSRKEVKWADDLNYIHHNRYSVTVIDKDPDSEICDRIEGLKYCSFERYFTSDNLNHFNYLLYY